MVRRTTFTYHSTFESQSLCSFLEGPKAALIASKDFNNGHYTSTPQHGIRAFARVYSAWAYGQTVRVFYRPLYAFADASRFSGTVSTSTFSLESTPLWIASSAKIGNSAS